MSLYQWAASQIQKNLKDSRDAGYDSALSLRALLSAVVQHSATQRDLDDLAQELRFLADNLGDDMDYGFMRP